MVAPVAKRVLDDVVALLGGDRLQFGLADDVARRVYVGICGLEALVNADRPVRLSLDAQRL